MEGLKGQLVGFPWTKIVMIQWGAKKVFPNLLFFIFWRGAGRGVMGISQKAISLNSYLTFVHTEEKKIRVFQSYMNLFYGCNTQLVFFKSSAVCCFSVSSCLSGFVFVFAGDSARWDLLSDHQAAHGQQERVSLFSYILRIHCFSKFQQHSWQFNTTSTLKDKWGIDFDNEFI